MSGTTSCSTATGDAVESARAENAIRSDTKVEGHRITYLDGRDGHVAEASSSNIFFVIGGELHTPEATEDVLVGVTRAAVIELAGELGLRVHERRIDRSESYVADEGFLCGTGVQIAPVTSIDRRPLGEGKPGPVTRRLQEEYLAAVRGEDDAGARHSSWRTPVYT